MSPVINAPVAMVRCPVRSVQREWLCVPFLDPAELQRRLARPRRFLSIPSWRGVSPASVWIHSLRSRRDRPLVLETEIQGCCFP
jgi:hypothetical protein